LGRFSFWCRTFFDFGFGFGFCFWFRKNKNIFSHFDLGGEFLVNLWLTYIYKFHKMSSDLSMPYNNQNQNQNQNDFQQNEDDQQLQQQINQGGKRKKRGSRKGKGSRKVKRGGLGTEAILATGALVLGNELYKGRSSSVLSMGRPSYRKGRRSNRRRKFTNRR
jgi:hypothetical protein